MTSSPRLDRGHRQIHDTATGHSRTRLDMAGDFQRSRQHQGADAPQGGFVVPLVVENVALHLSEPTRRFHFAHFSVIPLTLQMHEDARACAQGIDA